MALFWWSCCETTRRIRATISGRLQGKRTRVSFGPACRSALRYVSLPETQIWLTASCESADNCSNERSLPIDLLRNARTRPSRAALQAEILILRHQLNVVHT